ncbi:SGNH/GDSL hydrolase family protein [Telmatobacter bradus]|uniref:SGNH/GDSL hydrolase family protein n=1 Tax=Telmatobacter bradus TaxID=474953 RepID=UPI003B42C628
MKKIRKIFLPVFAQILLCSAYAQNAPCIIFSGPRWIASHGSAQQVPEPQNALPADAEHDITLREIFHLSAGGSEFRVRFSNAFGITPLKIAGAHVAPAVSTASAEIVAGKDRALTFAGATEVTIPTGAEYISDAVDLPVADLSNLAVSLHLMQLPGVQTGHPGSRATSYYVHGDAVSAANFNDPAKINHWYFVSGVDVLTNGGATLVALGDSITDGHGSTTNGNDRWPDLLSARLNTGDSTCAYGVVNAGIGGNHLLVDGLGPNAMARLDRDVLTRAGVHWAIVLEGVNDLGGLTIQAKATPAEHEEMVHHLEGAFQQIILRAHAAGLRIYGATILPYMGSNYYHPDAMNEEDRRALNTWIRAHYDAVVDFDAVMRDSQHPERLLPAYDSGDHLHPSLAGYKAMAAAIPKDLFTR